MSQHELERPGYLALYKPRRSSLAFIVEALVLLVFLIGSLAVITQVLALSANKATESRHLERAAILASNAAEQFSADPKSVEETVVVDGLALTCTVNETALAQGTRYEASIIVFSESGEVYRLNTTRYVPRAYTGVTSDSPAAGQSNVEPEGQTAGQDAASNANGAAAGADTDTGTGTGDAGNSASAGAPVEEVIE